MDSRILRALLYKDWSAGKKLLLVYFFGILFSASVNLIPGQSASFVASVLLITVFMTFYCHLALKLSMLERKDRNDLFLMTLPMSPRQYFIYKWLLGVFIFFTLWCCTLGLLGVYVISSDRIPSMLLSLYFLLFLMYIPSFLITLGVGLNIKNDGVVIFIMVMCNSLVTIATSIIGNLASVQQGFALGIFSQVGFVWPIWAKSYFSVMLVLSLFSISATLLCCRFKRFSRF